MKKIITMGLMGLTVVLGVNAACNLADGTVINVDIDKPVANKIFLKEEKIKFETSTTETGVTYAWSVTEGTCDPATATTEDFTTTLKSAGTIKIKLEVTNADNKSCEMTRTIKTIVPEVVEISWEGSNHDLLDGKTGSTAIENPVWIKTLGGDVTKNKAGAYTKLGQAEAKLKIKASQPLSNSTSVQVRGVGVAENDENFYPDDASFHDWTTGAPQLLSSPLYGSVNFYDTLDVKWQYRVEKLDGGWGDWVDMNQSEQLLYTVDDTPAANSLYAFGVDKACRYVDGAADIGSAINDGLALYHNYQPGFGCTQRHDLTLGIYGQCCCFSEQFNILVSHVTSTTPASSFGWGGCSSSVSCRYRKGTWWGPTFQCQRALYEGAPADPHFLFHIVSTYNGTDYDPSYGVTGWPTIILETAGVTTDNSSAASFQTGSSFPPHTSQHIHWVNEYCGH